ncbi:MAG: Hsp20/alpha crystallin family protein [Saprospiraceae bacterium]|nr:Hsp20/alpha crystallin family protein [Saprospiraceae bacterium]
MDSLSRINRNFPFFSTIPTWYDDFSGSELFKGNALNFPAINVLESIKHFSIEIAAPGFSKSNFKLKVDDNSTLTISVEKQDQQDTMDKANWKHREFNYTAFNRSFSLPNSIDQSHITAAYVDGILKIHLPKLEQFEEKVSKEIKIA